MRTINSGWKKDEYDDVGYFSEGRAWVEKGGKWGHVDIDGKVTTPIEYDYVMDFSEGRACVKKGGRWGHVDKQGAATWD
jgi:hypothetical protein